MDLIFKKPTLNNSKFKILNFELVLLFILIPVFVFAQSPDEAENSVSPRGAFLRSLAVPGWGHYYVDRTQWNQGKYHLAADAVSILSYLGLDIRAGRLEDSFQTLARSRAGANLNAKSRNYLIALGNFDNLSEYNNAQLQLRNWDQVFPDTPDYRWNWENIDYRMQYQDVREKADKTRRQLPAILGIMVANRLWSGISAFIKARDHRINLPEASMSYLGEQGSAAFKLKLTYSFPN